MTKSQTRVSQFFVWIFFLVVLTYCACAVEAQLMRTLAFQNLSSVQSDEDLLAEY